MQLKQEVKSQLNHIATHFEFSRDCSDSLRSKLITNGLVVIVEEAVLLTDAGEKAINLFMEELHLSEEPEEGFYNEDDNDCMDIY